MALGRDEQDDIVSLVMNVSTFQLANDKPESVHSSNIPINVLQNFQTGRDFVSGRSVNNEIRKVRRANDDSNWLSSIRDEEM
jgi:hypothetical protein